MHTNQADYHKAGCNQTGSLNHGLLNPEQARKFIQQTFELPTWGPLGKTRHETSKSG